MLTISARPFCLTALLAALAGALTGCTVGDPDQSFLADALDPIVTPTPTEAAIDMLDMDDADNRRRGVSLISAAPFGGEEIYLKVYRNLIRDPDPTVRAACARALGRHGWPEDAELLARIVDNQVDDERSTANETILRYEEPDPMVRWEAAKGLQKIHNYKAVKPLINAMLRDSDGDVRSSAATALGQYPRPDVYDALLGGLVDPQYRVVRAAQESLTTLTGYNLGDQPEDWLAYRDLNRKNLFADQQLYTYDPWVAPPGFFEKLKFWSKSKRDKAQPLVPAGL